MPYLFDKSKLNYSSNKVAVRNLISVCNAYEEIYSNIDAQLVLASESLQSWYSVWNGAFLTSDTTLSGTDPDHIQFLKQLSIILDVFFSSVDSIVTSSSVPISMETTLMDIASTPSTSATDTSLSDVSITTFTGNYYRTLKLKFLLGRLNNVGCALDHELPYDYIGDISSGANRYLNGHYVFRVGDFPPERIFIDLNATTLANIFAEGLPTNGVGSAEFGSSIASYGSVADSFARLKSHLAFSNGLLEDSRNLFEALL